MTQDNGRKASTFKIVLCQLNVLPSWIEKSRVEASVMIVVLKVKQSIFASADASIQRLISSQHEKQQIQWQEYNSSLTTIQQEG